MQLKQIKPNIAFGILTIIISLATWLTDLTGLVDPCIYCRTERTIIGILGILLLLPPIKFVTQYLGTVLGFFAAYVASEQIFILLSNNKIISLEFILAVPALFILVLQLILLWSRR